MEKKNKSCGVCREGVVTAARELVDERKRTRKEHGEKRAEVRTAFLPEPQHKSLPAHHAAECRHHHHDPYVSDFVPHHPEGRCGHNPHNSHHVGHSPHHHHDKKHRGDF